MSEAEWLVAVDVDYYPYVHIVAAATAEEAIEKAGVKDEATGVRWNGDEDGAVVFVAPMEQVSVFGSQDRVSRARETP